MDLKTALAQAAAEVERVVDALIPTSDLPEARLFASMRYAVLGGGKRLRPFLVLSAGALFDVPRERALRAGAAIEMIHSYSLVHDDLPAMDDSDLRRGRPTTHIQYDEATAILAGDALLTQAFEVLADPATHPDPEVRCRLTTALARAAGPLGMVGGQQLDLIAETTRFDLDTTSRLQRMKTGDMIAVSVEAGALLGGASDEETAVLRAYAHDIGLAFQIVDDLLDVEGDEAEMGKSLRRDEAAGKATFVSLLGIEGARSRAEELRKRAVDRLDRFGDRAEALRAVADFIVTRRN